MGQSPKNLSTIFQENQKEILTSEDEKFIASDRNLLRTFETGLESLLRKLKAGVPKKLVWTGVEIKIPAFPAAERETSRFAKRATGNHKATMLFKEYPATDEMTVYVYTIEGEVDSSAFRNSLGDRTNLFEQCITPSQADWLIEHFAGVEFEKRLEYIFMLEGDSQSEIQKEAFGDHERGAAVCFFSLVCYENDQKNDRQFNPHFRSQWWEHYCSIFPKPKMDCASFNTDRTWTNVKIVMAKKLG